jgi:hypothetical protein
MTRRLMLALIASLAVAVAVWCATHEPVKARLE